MITMPPFFTGEGPLLVLARGRGAWNVRILQPEMHVPGLLRLRKAILATWRVIHDGGRAETFSFSHTAKRLSKWKSGKQMDGSTVIVHQRRKSWVGGRT